MYMSKSDQIVCIETDLIQERSEILKRQTSYSHEQAEAALKNSNYDTMACIRGIFRSATKKRKIQLKNQ